MPPMSEHRPMNYSEDSTCQKAETTFPPTLRRNVSPQDPRGRRELSRVIRTFTTKRSLRLCGSAMATCDARLDMETHWCPPHDIRVDMGQNGLCFRGLFRCKSRHGCFHCARGAAAKSQHEMQEVCRAFLRAHPMGAVGFLTATLPHRATTPLETSLDAVLCAWRAVRQGRLAARLKSLGVAGYIRALDITYGGENGWHPHIHALILFERSPTDDELEECERAMFERWTAFIQRRGFPPVSARRFQLERSRSLRNVSRYCARAAGTSTWSQVVRELNVGTKQGHKGLSPAALYTRAAWGEGWALDCVHEFETVAHRRKFITWSRYAQKLRAKVPERADGDVWAFEDDSEVVPVFYLPIWLYRRLRDLPGGFDVLEAVFSIGRLPGTSKDYGGRDVANYERGSPADTAHLWLKACRAREGNTVPSGAWGHAIDFLSVVCTELQWVCSPYNWHLGQNWT